MDSAGSEIEKIARNRATLSSWIEVTQLARESILATCLIACRATIITSQVTAFHFTYVRLCNKFNSSNFVSWEDDDGPACNWHENFDPRPYKQSSSVTSSCNSLNPMGRVI